MAKKPDPKSTPGLVTIRLQLTEDERDKLRVIAAKSPQKTMAVFCREAIRRLIHGKGER